MAIRPRRLGALLALGRIITTVSATNATDHPGKHGVAYPIATPDAVRCGGGLYPSVLASRGAAGILTHRSDRLDQSGGYGEASRRLRADASEGRLLAALLGLSGNGSRHVPDSSPGWSLHFQGVRWPSTTARTPTLVALLVDCDLAIRDEG